MITAQSSTFTGTTEATLPVHRVRPTSRMFWLLFAAEGLVILAAVLLLIRLIPTAPPLVAANDYTLVREAILQRVNGVVDDPLIELGPGVAARSSSVRGFSLNGNIYYYYFEGEQRFDPLSRNTVTKDQVMVVLRDEESPSPLVIYTITN